MPPRRTGQPGPNNGELVIAEDGSAVEVDPATVDALEASGFFRGPSPSGPMMANAGDAGVLSMMDQPGGDLTQPVTTDAPLTVPDTPLPPGVEFVGGGDQAAGVRSALNAVEAPEQAVPQLARPTRAVESPEQEGPRRAPGHFIGGNRGAGRRPNLRGMRAGVNQARGQLTEATGERRDAMRRGVDAGNTALEAQADASTAAMYRLAEAEDVRRQATERANIETERMRERQDSLRERLDTRLSELDELERQVREEEIDPGRFWENQSTGGKIFTVLGMVLGSVGQAFNGQPNRAIDVVQGAIEQDLAAQRANLANRRDSLNAERSLYQELKDNAASELEADLAFQRMGLADADRQIEALMAGIQAEEYRAQGMAARAEIQQRIAALDAQIAGENEQAAAANLQARQRSLGAASRGPAALIDPNDPTLGLDRSEQVALGRYGDRRGDLVRAENVVDRLEQAARGGDTPGVGLVGGNLPGFLVGEQGREARNAIDEGISSALRARSGAAVTAEELENEKRALGFVGLNGPNGEENFRRGVRNLKREVERTRASVDASVTPRVSAAFEYRNRAAGGARDNFSRRRPGE